MSASLFNITPTLFEIGLVCGILTHNFGWNYAAVALGTVGASTQVLYHNYGLHVTTPQLLAREMSE